MNGARWGNISGVCVCLQRDWPNFRHGVGGHIEDIRVASTLPARFAGDGAPALTRHTPETSQNSQLFASQKCISPLHTADVYPHASPAPNTLFAPLLNNLARRPLPSSRTASPPPNNSNHNDVPHPLHLPSPPSLQPPLRLAPRLPASRDPDASSPAGTRHDRAPSLLVRLSPNRLSRGSILRRRPARRRLSPGLHRLPKLRREDASSKSVIPVPRPAKLAIVT